MKKVASFILAAMLASTLTATVSAKAVSTDIKNGTPVLDGKLDDIYKESASFTLENKGFYMWGNGVKDQCGDATAYFLWDSKYLYICVVADDSTPSSAADAQWQNDAAELWFVDEKLTFKVHAAADGKFFLGKDKDGKVAWDKGFDGATSKAVMGDKGWVVEVALPMNDLKAGKEFGFDLQVNDIYAPDKANGAASGGQNPADTTMKCVADKVVAKVEKPAAKPDTAAKTADMGIIASIAAMAASAAVVLKKKH